MIYIGDIYPANPDCTEMLSWPATHVTHWTVTELGDQFDQWSIDPRYSSVKVQSKADSRHWTDLLISDLTMQKLISFPDHFLRNCFQFLVLYTMYSSGLAVLYLSPLLKPL